MLSSFRIFEVSLYAVVNFLPYLIFASYIFYNRSRFSKRITIISGLITILVQIGTRFWGAASNDGNTINIILIRLIIYILIAAVAVDVHIGKILFTILIFSNISSFIKIAASAIRELPWAEEVHLLYCWHSSVIIIALHLVATLPFVLATTKHFKTMINNKVSEYAWSYYWIAPAIFYMMWQFLLYGSEQHYTEVINDLGNVLFLLIMNIGALLVYYIIIRLNNEFSKNLELERQRHYRDIEQLEYQLLEERIEDARRARHDMRHHIIIMSEYLEAKEYDQLQTYLSDYQKSLPSDRAIVFCPHRTINSIFLHFAHLAQEHEIDFQVQLSIPKNLSISAMSSRKTLRDNLFPQKKAVLDLACNLRSIL